jgi:hypothetical protein
MMAFNVTSDLLGLTSDIHAKFPLEIREITYKWILERNVLDLILCQASHDLASYPDPPSEKDLIYSWGLVSGRNHFDKEKSDYWSPVFPLELDSYVHREFAQELKIKALSMARRNKVKGSNNIPKFFTADFFDIGITASDIVFPRLEVVINLEEELPSYLGENFKPETRNCPRHSSFMSRSLII